SRRQQPAARALACRCRLAGAVLAVAPALTGLLRPRPRLGGAGREVEGLAQRCALEPLREQQRSHPEVGAVVEAGEVDAEHLVRLPLVPGGSAVDPGDTGQGAAVR